MQCAPHSSKVCFEKDNGMKVLLTGARGQLGSELVRQLNQGGCIIGALPKPWQGAEILSRDYPSIDLTSRETVERTVLEGAPDLVIHCAAMTNVDGCEDAPERAMLVNGEAVKQIAQACEQIGAKLVTLSTDYVFSGEKGSAYTESDPCDPQSAYGRSKLLGEQSALEHCSRTFVVRTAWLYGLHGHNFVKTILKKGREQESLHVVNDQFGNPTNAEDLAWHILKLAGTDRYGVYHCTGNGVCSWYEFAGAIAELAGLPCRVLPCTSQEYPQKAKRPAYSALEHKALQETIGDRMRPWREALKDYLNKLEGEA